MPNYNLISGLSSMTIKRLILALLTLLAIAKIFFSLNESLSQPQIQSRLELYQTNLVLHVSELKANSNDNNNLGSVINSIIGEHPYEAALEQYQQAGEESQISLDNFQTQLQQLESPVTARDSESNLQSISDSQAEANIALKQLKQQISSWQEFIDEIKLKQGILEAVKGDRAAALAIWNQLINSNDNSQNKYAQTAVVVKNLWQQSPQVLEESQVTIDNNLDGWFRYRALKKLYEIGQKEAELSTLVAREQELATKSIFRLATISGIPVFGGITGVSLLIFLLVQWAIKKERAILAINSDRSWETPWNWEIIWQVLIVGFFFVSQFVIPLILGISGLNPVNSSLRIKAVYVLITYLLMAIGGISVLYFSIKAYFPLPKDWFKIKLVSNWLIWGFGGYLIAIPLVLLISLINQQIWQGQGGSNPLLFLALQAQDKVALAIFFITASFAAPVFEEIMFRGFLLPSLTRYVPGWTAIIISGLIFAIAHLSLSEILPLATLGIILGIVYTRSRNLLAPMLLHSLWNSGTLISLFILGGGI